MNRGLLLKALRETWVMTGLFGLGLGAFEALMAYVSPTLFPDFVESLFHFEWYRRLLSALFGEELLGAIGRQLVHVVL